LSDKQGLNLELVGLYWHFVDIIWIVIFTVVYLLSVPPA
jgi:heme/copper-type cytochrome/quinol oxidase subunit 3